MAKYFKPEVGMHLATLDGQRFTNGYIFKIADNGNVTVLTDFGNLVTVFPSELLLHWEPMQAWAEAEGMGYPVPTAAERIQDQMDLLQKALNEIH